MHPAGGTWASYKIMKQIFPKEFLEYTSEVHRYRHRKKSLVIYAILLLSILGSLIALPFIKIPLSISSKGRITNALSTDTLLIAECDIKAGDIGLIRENIPVSFQIDSYDHNQWGMASGKILDVSRHAVMKQEQVIFRIRCSINETHLSLPSGQKGLLRNGQSLTAHIQLKERSLFELLSDQWHDLLDPNVKN